MLIYNETPMEVHVTFTWIPNEFILINAITMNMIWIHNDRGLKELVHFPWTFHVLKTSTCGKPMLHVHQEVYVLGCARDTPWDCLKHVCTFKNWQSSPVRSGTGSHCSASNEICWAPWIPWLALSTEYGIAGWTLHPLLTHPKPSNTTECRAFS